MGESLMIVSITPINRISFESLLASANVMANFIPSPFLWHIGSSP